MFKLAPLPRTLDAALRDATHPKPAIRLSAIQDLTQLAAGPHSDKSVEMLIGVLRDDPNDEVRARAAMALADARAEDARQQLVDATRDQSEKVAQMALLALGELGQGWQPAIAAVRRHLDARQPALRFQALVALHHLAPLEAAERVGDYLADADPEIRAVAVRIAEEHFADTAREPPPWLTSALPALCRDEASEVRLLASILRFRVTGATASEPIVAAVNQATGVGDPADEQAAIEIAGELRLNAAEVGLVRRAFGWLGFSQDRFAWQARVALAQMGHERASRSILKDLSSSNRDVRTLAVAAAGAARMTAARVRLLAMLGDEGSAEQSTVREALSKIEGQQDVPSTR